jgi:pimeloyl-ACP methyl ester carboxylesterase
VRPGPYSTPRVLRVALAGALTVVSALPAADTVAASPEKHQVAGKNKKPRHGPKPKLKKLAQKKAPALPPPLEGTSYDYDYDGRDVGHPERRWMGRAFVHKKAAALAGQALPVLVFLHGNNAEAIKYRWMGGGTEGDLRRVVSEMIEAGQVPPMLVAAPSSIDPTTMTNAGLSWPAFDLDVFLDRTADRLGSAAVIDRGRVVVAAHSGGGCNIHGGLNSAVHAQATPVLAGLSIDTCMLLDLAKELAHLRPTTHVIVSWQSMSWPEREFGAFKTMFLREVKKAPPPDGVLRELDYEQPTVPMPHDAIVGITLKKWLPRVLPTAPADRR